MKHLILAWICLLGVVPAGVSQGLLLNSGDSYTYTFTNFLFQASGSTGPRAQVGLTLSNLTPADSFVFTAYENSLLESALITTNFDGSSGIPLFQLGSAWQDFQGVFKIEMVTGSMTLLDFVGSVVTVSGDYYSEKPLAVPEPSPHVLLGAGLIVLLFCGSLKRVRRPTGLFSVGKKSHG